MSDAEIAIIDQACEALDLDRAPFVRRLALLQARRILAGLPPDPSLALPPEPMSDRDATRARVVAALEVRPQRTDTAIADELGLTSTAVRDIRRAEGIPGVEHHKTTDWRARITDAHARGLTTAAIAAETGYTVRTVQQRLAELGLKAHRPPRSTRTE
jgi:hypothetical protein